MTSAMMSAISGTGKVSADGLPPPNEIMFGSAPSLNSSRMAEPVYVRHSVGNFILHIYRSC